LPGGGSAGVAGDGPRCAKSFSPAADSPRLHAGDARATSCSGRSRVGASLDPLPPGACEMEPDRRRLHSAVLVAFIGTLVTTSFGRAQSITSLDWKEPVVLKLTDGRRLEGRYCGTLGSPDDGSDYAETYQGWRESLGPDGAPALGETLVVALRSGE